LLVNLSPFSQAGRCAQKKKPAPALPAKSWLRRVGYIRPSCWQKKFPDFARVNELADLPSADQSVC